MPLTTGLGGKTAGIVGLGRIGKAVARRLVACGMTIAYHGRKPQPGIDYTYYKDVLDLALASDLLVLSCPGTPETHGMINADVLRALGPKGFIVNVARGGVIDEAAMIDALKNGAIAGAGLDVTIGEPNPNPALTSLENVVVLPHIGGAAAETRFEMYDVMIINLKCFFAGEPLPNRFDIRTITATV
jgi:lactate dehydrogenase-like 2-hydroxyacid dehydrogenase